MTANSAAEVPVDKIPIWLKGLATVALLGLVAGGIWYYLVQDRELHRTAAADLEAVAEAKIGAISVWSQERLIDAMIVASDPFFATIRESWTTDLPANDCERMRKWFQSLNAAGDYCEILLTDQQGRVRFTLNGRRDSLSTESLQALGTALRERRPVLVDLHVDPENPAPHLNVVAPIYSEAGTDPHGAIVLESDAERFLYPLIASWPLPSLSAETVLVRRDGDSVLFLNDLRHLKGTALNLRIPLSQTDVPAVLAVLGMEGVIEGRDYRDVKVLSVLKAIPDSPWFMVAKEDSAEALATWRIRSMFILAMLISLFCTGIAVAGIVWQRQQKSHFKRLFHAEAVLRQSEARHHTVLMSVGDGVVVTDAAGRVEILNPVGEAITGWNQEDALGRPLEEIFRIINEETRQETENPVQRVGREGIVVDLANHTLLIARDGTERPIADSGAPIHDDQGAITGAVLVFRDQTEERQTLRRLEAEKDRSQKYLADIRAQQAKLSESEEKYRLLTENAVSAIAVHEIVLDDAGKPVDYIFLSANPAFEVETGLKVADIQSRRVTEILPGIENTPLIEIYGKVVLTGEPVCFEQYAKPLDRHYMINAYRLGERRFATVFTNITDRKRAEERLGLVAGAMIDLVYEWVVASDTLEWFGDLDHVLGYEPGDIERTVEGWVSLIHPEDVERFRDSVQLHRTSPEPIFETYRIRRADGVWVWWEVRGTAVLDENGTPTKWVGSCTDITERIQAQKEQVKLESQLRQAHKMEAVGRLAGGVAHDFNNMLSVILGHTGMILELVDPDQPIHADLVEIKKAGERSADLTRQLLAFASKQTVAPKVIDLNETIVGITRMLQRLIGENIDLAWRPGKDLGLVKMDPSQIDQILANLCVNARDAISGVGKIIIETGNAAFDETYCEDHTGFVPGKYVMLVVSDDGCGADSKTLAHVFEPFFTTKAPGSGTGLGLATVYGAVKQNQGFINVYSEPGKGTTFKIYLPRYLATAAHMPEKELVQPVAHGHETILLVEDEEAILRLITRMLESLGYTVVAACIPGDAIKLAEEYRGEIHLLLTDVVMPLMNGRDLAKSILDHYPEIKCLFMSGYTANVIAHHGVLDPGVNFIQKPFSKVGLGTKVREALTECEGDSENGCELDVHSRLH